MTGRGQTARDDKHGFVLSVIKAVSQPSPGVPPRIDIARCSAPQSHAQLHPLGFSEQNRTEQNKQPGFCLFTLPTTEPGETFTTNLLLVLCFLRKRESNSTQAKKAETRVQPAPVAEQGGCAIGTDMTSNATAPWESQKTVRIASFRLNGA